MCYCAPFVQKIFGSVTKEEVAELIKVQMGEELDKRKIELPEIRETGLHEVSSIPRIEMGLQTQGHIKQLARFIACSR